MPLALSLYSSLDRRRPSAGVRSQRLAVSASPNFCEKRRRNEADSAFDDSLDCFEYIYRLGLVKSAPFPFSIA